MKTRSIIASILLLTSCALGFTSCNNENDELGAKPVINLTEIGKENSKSVVAGNEMHLEGDIVAENTIARIDVKIHMEENGEFEIEKSYTSGVYIGVKNTIFHEHIDIPAEAPAGKYHLHFIVTDRLGLSEIAESEIFVTTNITE